MIPERDRPIAVAYRDDNLQVTLQISVKSPFHLQPIRPYSKQHLNNVPMYSAPSQGFTGRILISTFRYCCY